MKIWIIVRRLTAATFVVSVAGIAASCGALDVSDPTVIEDSELNDAISADLLRLDAVRAFNRAVTLGALGSGTLADEFFSNPPPTFRPAQEMELDQRNSATYEALVSGSRGSSYGLWQDVRRATGFAATRLRDFGGQGAGREHVGQMLALQAFAALQLAEDFCPGLPLHRVVEYKPIYGPPLSTDEIFQSALADFDSALVYAGDSARFLNLARVAAARALVGLGRFAEAAAAAREVPTNFAYEAEYLNVNNGFLENILGGFGRFGSLFRSVANRDGGTGLDFVSAGDPRLETVFLGTAFDGATGVYRTTKYSNVGAPIVIASGIEARLIEAEAALRDGGNWLGILNALRTNGTQAGGVWNPGSGGVASLPPLADPGEANARVDMLFRERAFWLFGTGHRLGDLRRLINRYGRGSENVFPTGAYRLGGAYGSGTSIPFPGALETPYSPAVTGCTIR